MGADAVPSAYPNSPGSTAAVGSVDEAAVYTTALAASQVAAHFADGRS
ncbi:MAG TPA: hypothetical protein VFJ97_00245 [Dermatophilaceae bacterium]|nr:hypothetical protein [Dermatophilaceae bacterium]